MSDDLKQLLADLELLDGIATGKVSPVELARRVVLIGDDPPAEGCGLLCVSRGYLRDEMMREKVDPNDPESITVGDAAWEIESEEDIAANLAEMEEFAEKYGYRPSPPSAPPIEPTPTLERSPDAFVAQIPDESKSSHVLKVIRRAIRR